MRISRLDKEKLYRDGYLVVRGAVARERVESARRLLNQRQGRLRLHAVGGSSRDKVRQLAAETFSGDHPDVLGLYNDSGLRQTVAQLVGDVPEARGAQVANTYPGKPGEYVTEAGYRDRDLPFYGWAGHLDGCWNGGSSPLPLNETVTPAMRRRWYRAESGNGCQLSYPGFNSNIKNFTCLVGVALSDQRRVGVGNLGVLKGGHRAMADVFTEQMAKGGPLGPDGPGWPREFTDAPNGHGLNHYPETLRQQFRRGAGQTADGRLWPKPTFLKLAPGDAVIVHFATPHAASRNEGPDPRMMVYFRVTPASRPRRFRDNYNAALTDIWQEWPGLRAVVKSARKP